MAEPVKDKHELVRGLDFSATTSLVVGTIIGTGVFLKTTRMAQAVGTPWMVLLAWAAAGMLSLAGALSYAELGAMLPNAGGEYVYLRAAYGNIPAFLFGWMRLVIGSTGSIASFGSAFATFLAVLVPMSSAWTKAVGVAVILGFSGINCLRVAIGGHVQAVLTLAKVLAIATIAGGVFFFARSATWENFRTPAGVPNWCGFSAFGAAMLAAMWAFDGWNNMPMAAGEVRDPGRNIPRALIVGMTIVLLVYGCSTSLTFMRCRSATSPPRAQVLARPHCPSPRKRRGRFCRPSVRSGSRLPPCCQLSVR